MVAMSNTRQGHGDVEYSSRAGQEMSNIRRGAAKFLVIMDKPGTRGPPGHFYTKLNELGSLRIQRSVYLVDDGGTTKVSHSSADVMVF